MTKKSQERVKYEKLYMVMTNTTVYYASKKQKSTSDYTSDLDQIKYIGVPIYRKYRWKY